MTFWEWAGYTVWVALFAWGLRGLGSKNLYRVSGAQASVFKFWNFGP